MKIKPLILPIVVGLAVFGTLRTYTNAKKKFKRLEAESAILDDTLKYVNRGEMPNFYCIDWGDPLPMPRKWANVYSHGFHVVAESSVVITNCVIQTQDGTRYPVNFPRWVEEAWNHTLWLGPFREGAPVDVVCTQCGTNATCYKRLVGGQTEIEYEYNTIAPIDSYVAIRFNNLIRTGPK